MGTRRSASTLSDADVDQFVQAITVMKTPGADGVSLYDRFVALHGAVMRVEVRFQGGEVQQTNMAHWNIAFCPWHRQYLLAFEQALQVIDPDVDLPYWDWDDHGSAEAELFTDRFAGSFGPDTGPADVADGRFSGFPIHAELQEIWDTPLERGGGLSVSWPPTPGGIAWLENLRFSAGGTHPLWIFWRILEEGWPNAVTATHNAAHNFIGGHMAGAFSPNDPIFWMHHANVDRLWHRWQQNYAAAPATEGLPASDWPDPTETSPFDGNPAPYGHRLNDLMWPWVGQFSGAFESLSASPAQLALLQDPATLDVVRVSDVLDIGTLGYDYL